MRALRPHVVGKNISKLVVTHLADIGGAPAQGRDPGDRIRGRSAGHLGGRTHFSVKFRRAAGIDQLHDAFFNAIFGQEIIRTM